MRQQENFKGYVLVSLIGNSYDITWKIETENGEAMPCIYSSKGEAEAENDDVTETQYEQVKTGEREAEDVDEERDEVAELYITPDGYMEVILNDEIVIAMFLTDWRLGLI